MIYLDHAAATPVSKRALEAMMPYFREEFFNPSAAYLPAKKVAAEYEAAKKTIAQAIGAKSADLVITAGATEANNLAFTALSARSDFFGSECPTGPAATFPPFSSSSMGDPQVASPVGVSRTIVSGEQSEDLLRSGSRRSRPSPRGERANPRAAALRNPLHRSKSSLLYLETEHPSVAEAAKVYGGTAVKVLSSGVIDLNDLRAKITDETEMISVAAVNNELGTIQPLAEIAEIIREVKLERMKKGLKRQLLFHSDASQALNLLDLSVARLGVDLLTLNSAKVYGPKGVGALYVSHGARLQPLTVGGGQEKGLRSGTENVPGVVGFAEAVKETKEHLNGNRKKYRELKRILLTELQGYELINKKHTLDNFVVLCYNGLDAERLIFLLEEQGVYVATGAACAASKGEKSRTLKAIGLTDAEIAGSLRLSLGATNDAEQMHEAARIINAVVAQEKARLGYE